MTERAKEIFADALELPQGERRAFVDKACAGQRELRGLVERLLGAHESARDFMDAPTLEVGDATHEPCGADGDVGVGATIGHYTLESVLGEGGFGTVYLARQTEPVARTVAIKVLRPGVVNPAMTTRLEAERQALAMMDHAGVARIFEAGQTPSGRPYFVMEYVEGEPITGFCRRNATPLRDRLALFERVCLAIQHAHHKGIIHRDIKPTNVLVSLVDGAPTPKVIDFGIAKIVDPARPDMTAITRHGDLLGTPAYMSPEQISGSAGMDTRSDVYALGVLLYELLTGELPFDAERAQSLTSLARAICEEAPPKPSSRLPQAGGSGEPASAGLTPSRLRGDLDWIAMRALEKDPARRYGSPGAFAADIRRYLNDEAVEAGPPRAWYRFRKFASRHRGEVAAGAASLALLVALLVVSVVFGARVDAERGRVTLELEKSRAFSEFASAMLSGVDPEVARGQDTALMRQILDDAAARLAESPPVSREADAEMLGLVGVGYWKIGDVREAERRFRAAAEAAEESMGSEHTRTLELRASHGKALAESTRYEEAEAILSEVLDARRRTLGPSDPATLTSMFDMASLKRLRGEHPEAAEELEEVIRLRSELFGPDHADVMSARNALAMTLDALGETDEAIPLYETVIEHQRRTLGPDHPGILATQNNLADSYITAGRNEDAVELLETVLAAKRRLFDPDHPSILVSLNNLASAHQRAGQREEAGRMLAEALRVSRANFGEDDRRTLIVINNLASFYIRGGEYEAGRELLREALPRSESSLGPDHPLTLAMLTFLGGASLETERFEDAAAHAEKLVGRSGRTFPANHPQLASHRRLYARALLGMGEAARAERLLLDAWAIDEAGGSTDGLSRTAAYLAEACDALGKAEEAARWRAWSPGMAAPGVGR